MDANKAKAAMDAKRKKQLGLNIARLKQLLDTAKTESDYFKFPAGDTKFVLLLNPNDADGMYCYYQRRHWIPDSDGKSMPYNCPKVADNAASCPACEASKALYNTGDAVDKDRARSLSGRDRYLANLFLVERNQVVQCELPKTVFEPIARADYDELVDEAQNGRVEASSVAHPETPRVIKVHVEGSGQKTEYSVTVSTKTIKVTPDMLQARKDMSDETSPASYDAIEEAVCGFLNINDLSDVTAAVKPSRSTAVAKANTTKPSKPAAVEADVDEVETEAEPDEYPECLGEYDPKLDGKMDKQYGFVRQCKKCVVREICQGTEVVGGDDEEE